MFLPYHRVHINAEDNPLFRIIVLKTKLLNYTQQYNQDLAENMRKAGNKRSRDPADENNSAAESSKKVKLSTSSDITALPKVEKWLKSLKVKPSWMNSKYRAMGRWSYPNPNDEDRRLILTRDNPDEANLQVIANSGMPVNRAIPSKTIHHFFDITHPYGAAEVGEERYRHPKTTAMMKRLGFLHKSLVIGYFTDEMKFVGRRYELFSVNASPTRDIDPDTWDVIWRCSQPKMFHGRSTDVPEFGPPWVKYRASIDWDFSVSHYNLIDFTANQIYQEHGWKYNCKTFNCSIFVETLFDRLKKLPDIWDITSSGRLVRKVESSGDSDLPSDSDVDMDSDGHEE